MVPLNLRNLKLTEPPADYINVHMRRLIDITVHLRWGAARENRVEADNGGKPSLFVPGGEVGLVRYELEYCKS